MAATEKSPSLSASTETLSDLEEQGPSEVSVSRNGRYTETFGSEEAGSGSDSNQEIEVDSEATVSDDLNLQESGSDTFDTANWQPSPRLTARQQARQQRLLQGIQQTQWNDMSLPPALDFSNKNKQKDVLSAEQHLKRMKDAETRRLRTQKARRDTMEHTKARIRAASSNKFKDILGNGHIEKRKVVRSNTGFLPGRVRIKKRCGSTVLVLPEGLELPHALKPKQWTHYPPQKIFEKLVLDPRHQTENFVLGGKLELVSEEQSRVGIFMDGIKVGLGTSQNSFPFNAHSGILTAIDYGNQNSRMPTITVRLMQRS